MSGCLFGVKFCKVFGHKDEFCLKKPKVRTEWVAQNEKGGTMAPEAGTSSAEVENGDKDGPGGAPFSPPQGHHPAVVVVSPGLDGNPDEYYIEDLREKSYSLDWIATQIVYQRPFKTKHAAWVRFPDLPIDFFDEDILNHGSTLLSLPRCVSVLIFPKKESYPLACYSAAWLPIGGK